MKNAMTKTKLNRMKVAELAQYAARVLNLPDYQCYAVRGGPLPKQMLLLYIQAELNKFA